MSIGIKLQHFVETLKLIDFPVDTVPGGDIHKVLNKNLPFVDSVKELHTVTMDRRKAKEAIQKSLNRIKA